MIFKTAMHFESLPLARGGGPLAVEGIVRDTKILLFPGINALEGVIPAPPRIGRGRNGTHGCVDLFAGANLLLKLKILR